MPALRTGNHIGLPLQILAKLNHYSQTSRDATKTGVLFFLYHLDSGSKQRYSRQVTIVTTKEHYPKGEHNDNRIQSVEPT